MKTKGILIAAVLLIAVLGSIFWLSLKRTSRLGKVQAFHYQLKGYAPGFVATHSQGQGTLFVLDGTKFTRTDVEKLRGSSNRVLAFLKIAEPSVEYWRPEWQARVLTRLTPILDAGFDGVFLDGVDAFQEFMSRRPVAARDMIEWIGKLASVGRKQNGRFAVVLQNGACLTDLSNFPGADEKEYTAFNSLYLATIDGESVEQAFFQGDEFKPQQEVLRCVQALQNHHKRVFGVEYLRDHVKQARALDEMHSHGITGVVTDRALSGEFFRH